jgi:hypothetical protein
MPFTGPADIDALGPPLGPGMAGDVPVAAASPLGVPCPQLTHIVPTTSTTTFQLHVCMTTLSQRVPGRHEASSPL